MQRERECKDKGVEKIKKLRNALDHGRVNFIFPRRISHWPTTFLRLSSLQNILRFLAFGVPSISTTKSLVHPSTINPINQYGAKAIDRSGSGVYRPQHSKISLSIHAKIKQRQKLWICSKIMIRIKMLYANTSERVTQDFLSTQTAKKLLQWVTARVCLRRTHTYTQRHTSYSHQT